MKTRSLALAAGLFASATSSAEAIDPDQAARAVLRAYPASLDRIDGGEIITKAGKRVAIGAGHASLPWTERLDRADVVDMFAQPYTRDPLPTPPAHNEDPGRARSAALFNAMYGDCTKNETAAAIVAVPWLPAKRGGVIRVTTVNGVDKALAAVSKELDALPESFDRFLKNPAGGYVCRPVAGSKRPSAHGWGIAVDIAAGSANYWLWAAGRIAREGASDIRYRNAIPREIVDIFERHGFVWGGKWYHYDTMHFEYRPELIAP